MEKKRIQGNRDNSYSLLEKAKGYYHVEIIKRVHIAKESRYQENVIVQMFTQADYKIWKTPEAQQANGIFKARILHDPTMGEKKPEKKEIKK